MAPFYAANGAGELLPRYSFLEPLLDGRRVLELGAAGATDGASAVFLAERGAAAVLSVDEPEGVERAAQAAHHPFVQFRAVDPASLPRGAFDLVVIADGAGLATDPTRVAELKGLLADDGLLVAAIRAPGGAGLLALQGERPPGADEVPAYESFAGALAAEFEVVEMATQSAMVGYVLAPGQPGEEPEITVDGSLAGPAEAAYYLAICGAEPSGLEGLTLVALPPRPLAEAAVEHGEAARAHQGCLAAAEAGADTEALRRAVAEREEALVAKDVEIAEALARVAERERLVAEKDARLAELEVDAEAARVRADGVGGELERERETLFEAQAARDALRARVQELEARGEAGGRAAEEASRTRAELDAERTSRIEVEASAQAARAEAQAARAGVQSALARAEGAEGRAAELEQALDEVRRREAEARAEIESRSAALDVRSAELEMRAAEQEARVAELEAALARSREALGAREAAEAKARTVEGEAARRAEAAEARAAAAEGAAGQAGAERERLRQQVEDQSLARARFETESVATRSAAEAAEAQAAALEAELQAVRWERDELEQRVQSAAHGAGAGSAGEVGRLREELAARSAELEAIRGAAERSAAEAAAAAARVEQLEARAGQGAAGPAGRDPALEARVRELEARLAEALRRQADAQALAQATRAAAAGGQAAEVAAAMQKLAQERDTYAAQLADRDARIAKLQREVADKTERLGRLAQEVGELKSKGLGKLFSR
jgi:chromosome segregation ATPase